MYDSELYVILRTSDLGRAWEVTPFFCVKMCLTALKRCWFILMLRRITLQRREWMFGIAKAF